MADRCILPDFAARRRVHGRGDIFSAGRFTGFHSPCLGAALSSIASDGEREGPLGTIEKSEDTNPPIEVFEIGARARRQLGRPAN